MFVFDVVGRPAGLLGPAKWLVMASISEGVSRLTIGMAVPVSRLAGLCRTRGKFAYLATNQRREKT